MANTFMNGLKSATNYGYTENGAVKHNTTGSDLLDMFALGGAYRQRSNDDVVTLFKLAYAENPTYALKCLFYLRDVRGGQGERRFFRVCLRWLANNHPDAVLRNLENIPEYGRYDDLYELVDTSLENEMFAMIKKQLALDIQCKTPSLLAKWLKSENTSSDESRMLGAKTRRAMGMTARQYRKTLSILRARINVLERLMSAGRWDEIEFDKIPSKAGLKYKNAFARRDIIKKKYEAFITDKNTKVNATVLNPVDIAEEIYNNHPTSRWSDNVTPVQRAAWDKYWANLKDYYNGREENGIAVVDVSGSMSGQPMAAAVSMGAYIAERGKGPFANHFITFSSQPQLVRFEGADLYDKFWRARNADWQMNTNLKGVFNLLLNTAIKNNCSQDELPTRLYIFSDMEFDSCITNSSNSGWYNHTCLNRNQINTLVEDIKKEWAVYGYKMPQIVFWNLRAASQNIPAIGEGFSYVSGFSMNMVENILSGKDGFALMMDKLNSERYAAVK